MTEIEKAYAAGIIDGEGSIVICKQKRKRPSSFGPTYYLVTNVEMGSASVIHWLHHTTGYGSVGSRVRKSHKRVMWHWTVTSNSAAEFLREIYQYLVQKRSEVDIALEFQDHVARNSCRYKRLSEDIIQFRDDKYLKLKRIHAGG